MTSVAFQRVRDKYLLSLPEKAAALERALLDTAGFTRDPADLAGLLHKLSGSAGFYGKAALASQAQSLESRVLARPDEAEQRLILERDVAALIESLRSGER